MIRSKLAKSMRSGAILGATVGAFVGGILSLGSIAGDAVYTSSREAEMRQLVQGVPRIEQAIEHNRLHLDELIGNSEILPDTRWAVNSPSAVRYFTLQREEKHADRLRIAGTLMTPMLAFGLVGIGVGYRYGQEEEL